ncbi:hypothetical protein L6452_34426 [Arctium lappa]|uniref:Uncharacterized protein n=1 Tax=Arctium lappa TaxID=4217 RepID=A0ACB8YIQ6_ARCLA|nr:hypothetical protein L6452_34426 [Arctium lappa]
MAEEGNWLFQSSDEEEQAHFTQVSYMAKLDDNDETSKAHSKDENSEVNENSELIESLMVQIHSMKDEFELLKGKLSSEHQTVLSFRDENALLKDKSSGTDLQNSFKSVGFKYSDLNKSYETRKIEFVEFESLFTTPSNESVNNDKIPPETKCKYDEYESDADPSIIPSVSNPITLEPLLVEKVEEEANVTNESCFKNDKMEFVENMTETIFSKIMNASDPDLVSVSKESNSVNGHTSDLMKQIDMLQKSLDEIEDENFDLKFKLEKSLKDNQELCNEINDLIDTLFKNVSMDKQMPNDQSWKVRSNPKFDESTKPSVIYSECPDYLPSTFEKGETSGISRKRLSSKKKTDKVSVSVLDLNGNGVWRTKENKNDCSNVCETDVENSCTQDSDDLRCTSFDEYECQICSDKSKFMTFVIDSGCSRHMTGFKHVLHNYVEEPAGTVRFANSEVEGHVRGYETLDNGVVKIQKVLYVEGLDHNLFSTSHFCDMKYQVRFRTSHCYLEDPDGYEIFRSEHRGNLYYVDFPTLSATRPICLLAKASKAQSWTWNRRLSHQNFRSIAKLQRQELIHMDLCGPMRTASINGKKYVLVMMDDYSRYTWLEFLRNKSDAPELIIAFIKRIQNGIVERKNHILVEVARTMLAYANLPMYLWVEAVATTFFTQNRTTVVKRLNKTAYELINNRKPNIKLLRVFGFRCYILIERQGLSKFDKKVDEGYLGGY